MEKRKERITVWLRKRISYLDYGFKYYGRVIHCNTNEEVLRHLRTKVNLSHLTNQKLANHFSGEDTFYFAGNSWGSETLVMIDVDCHGVGTLQGAMSYAQFLKDMFFPNLYFEPSTNGNGVHGYFVLDKDGVKPEVVNDLLGQLQTFLRQTTQGFDIEMVEIKGRCPVIVWGQKRGEVTNYKAGTLAKIPRQADRFVELKNTTKFSVTELRRMIAKPMPTLVVPIIKMAAIPKPATVKAKVATKVCASKVSIPKVREVKAITGSCSDRVISEEELAKLQGHYLKVAETLLGVHPIKTGRVVATAHDLAITLMLLKWFSGHMNADGSLPWARFKGLWDALYQAKDIDRAFDPKRFAALRNYLSSLGLIEWEDHEYHVGHWVDGAKVGGKACKWKANEKLMEMLHEEEKEEGERTSLAGTSTPSRLQHLIQHLERLPAKQTTTPIQVIQMSNLNPTEHELRRAMGMAA
jgi:hypothetical protein